MFRVRSLRATRALALVSLTSFSLFGVLVNACSSSDSPPALDAASTACGAGVSPTEVVTSDAAPPACAKPGAPTAGPKDAHCKASDGGLTVQDTSAAVCCVNGDAGDPEACPYEATMFGLEGDDDDCKYHVAWTSSPICEGASGVAVTVVATNLATGKPVVGAAVQPEVFTTSPPSEAGCDDMSSHLSPSTFEAFAEGPPGTYRGRVVFDTPGQWTLRFHLFEDCYDVLPSSPHGHAAFHVTVP
jgi:hypothetical protein